MKNEIISFIQQVFKKTDAKKAVIGVSGGIDSAVVLTLLTEALTCDQIIPTLMPFAKQDMTDAVEICSWNGFSKEQIIQIDIEPIVRVVVNTLGNDLDQFQKGNVMARSRMMILFNSAKKHQGLVVGTENKSENLLGYFTRFGDSASDLEPIAHLYKTQVKQLAQELGLSSNYLNKPPSAGLWQDQTDEQEFGFSYTQADQILAKLEKQSIQENRKLIELVEEQLKQAELGSVSRQVLQRVKQNWFKQEVPYKIH